jgi:hypothetical protein
MLLSDEKLSQVLPIIYRIWNNKFDQPIEPNDISIGKSEVWGFFTRIAKSTGLNGNFDSFYYFMNALYRNQDYLKDGNLNSNNVENPQKKEYRINVTESRTEHVKIWGSMFTDGYFTRDQLTNDIYELHSEGEVELYDYEEDDRDVYDSDSIDGVEVEGVDPGKVISEKTNSLHNFLDSLTESEIHFLKNELNKRLL